MKFATSTAAFLSLGIFGLSIPLLAQKPARAPKLVKAVVPVRSTPSVWDGVYTVDQARRGAAITSRCVSCHGPDLSGDTAPTLVGPAFAARWNGWMLGDLTERINAEVRTLAPLYVAEDKEAAAGDPASLRYRQSADVLAYILLVNRFPGGQVELPVNPVVQSQILFKASKP